MKLEFMVFIITGFLVTNTYYDGKYTKMLTISKKYIQMSMFAFVGFSIYLLLKKNPNESRSILSHANTLIKYMPIDKDTTDLISPIFDFTRMKNDISSFSSNDSHVPYHSQTPQMKRMMGSGNTNNRCVSETKKKYVASQQGWKCAKCGNQLTATFEVDHKIDLQLGGTNHVSNLAAMCRECHGEKTMMRNLQ
jgi:hypothetical protein|tara:strand:+ start:598 stop:1176 length:579 start_codon:yes stop_codon:yes gene_type:complete